MFAPLLQKIGVTLRVDNDAFDGCIFVVYVQMLGGFSNGRLCCEFIQLVNDGVIKQPLGIGLRFARQAQQLGQAGAHDGERQFQLRAPMQR